MWRDKTTSCIARKTFQERLQRANVGVAREHLENNTLVMSTVKNRVQSCHRLLVSGVSLAKNQFSVHRLEQQFYRFSHFSKT